MNDPRELRTRDTRPHTVKRRGDLILRYVGDDTAAISGNPYAVRRVDEHATGDSLFDGAVQLASGTLAEMETFFREAIDTRRVTVDSEPAPGKFVYGVFLADLDTDFEHVELVEIVKPRPITDFEIDNLITLYARARGIDVSFLYVALKSPRPVIEAAVPTPSFPAFIVRAFTQREQYLENSVTRRVEANSVEDIGGVIRDFLARYPEAVWQPWIFEVRPA